MYLVALWANYGVREYAFSGKYKINEKGVAIPLVYDYDDHNGTCDSWFLRPITCTTTGFIIFWTPYKGIAEKVAEALRNNKKEI